MPLSKQAKALYEAALRRKGLQPGKAVRQDPRTFVGPIEMEKGWIKDWIYSCKPHYVEGMVPARTYWNSKGRFQDLEDELDAAIESGRWERKNPMAHTYRRYYNDGDIPSMPGTRWDYFNGGYDNPNHYKYQTGWDETSLTRLGELELEARADEMIENDYKNYLRQMYGGKIKQRPPKYGVRVWDRLTHEPLVSEYDELDDALKGLRRNRDDYGSAYLEEIWPE